MKPTKQQIRVARNRLKKSRALRREAMKVLRKIRSTGRRRLRRRLPPPSPEARNYYTWIHDVEILMQAVVRTPGSHVWTPAEIAKRAAAAADQMKTETEARHSESGFRYRHWQWESVFDGFVHDLAERSPFDATDVVKRAAELADAMARVIARRRAAKRGHRRTAT